MISAWTNWINMDERFGYDAPAMAGCSRTMSAQPLTAFHAGGPVTAQPESNASGSTQPHQFDKPAVNKTHTPPDQWLIAALEEYRSLRVEIIDAIEAQRKIMQLGVTALSVLVGLGLQRIDPLLAVALLTLLVPTLAIFMTAGALGERFRASRASYFLASKEKVINQALAGSAPALEWEQWLRGRSIFILRDKAEFFAVFSLTTAALGLGFYMLLTTPALHVVPSIFIISFSLALWMTCITLYLYLIEMSRNEFRSGGLDPPPKLARIVNRLLSLVGIIKGSAS